MWVGSKKIQKSYGEILFILNLCKTLAIWIYSENRSFIEINPIQIAIFIFSIIIIFCLSFCLSCLSSWVSPLPHPHHLLFSSSLTPPSISRPSLLIMTRLSLGLCLHLTRIQSRICIQQGSLLLLPPLLILLLHPLLQLPLQHPQLKQFYEVSFRDGNTYHEISADLLQLHLLRFNLHHWRPS